MLGLQAANLDMLMRIYTLLATAANTRQEQSAFAIKAQACGVSLLLRSTGNVEDSKATGGFKPSESPVADQRPQWYFMLKPHMAGKIQTSHPRPCKAGGQPNDVLLFASWLL